MLLAVLAASLMACRLFSPPAAPAAPLSRQPNSSSLHVTPTPARPSAYTPAALFPALSPSDPGDPPPSPAPQTATPAQATYAPAEAATSGSMPAPHAGIGGASGIGSPGPTAAANIIGVVSGAGSSGVGGPAVAGILQATPTLFAPASPAPGSPTAAGSPTPTDPSASGGTATPAPYPDILAGSPTAAGSPAPAQDTGTPLPAAGTLTPTPAAAAQAGATATAARARRLRGACRAVVAISNIQKLFDELPETDKRWPGCDR